MVVDKEDGGSQNPLCSPADIVPGGPTSQLSHDQPETRDDRLIILFFFLPLSRSVALRRFPSSPSV